MKRIMIVLALITVVVGQALGNSKPANVEPVVIKSLQKHFPGAQFAKVQKVEGEDLYSVRMVYNDESMLAYTHANGKVVAVVRAMTKERLPMLVNQRLHRQYNDYLLRQAEELNMNGETSYLFKLENETHKVSLRIYSNGDAVVMKREKR